MDRDDIGDRLEAMSARLAGLNGQLQKHAETPDFRIETWTGKRLYESLEGHHVGVLLQQILAHLNDIHEFLVVTNPPTPNHQGDA